MRFRAPCHVHTFDPWAKEAYDTWESTQPRMLNLEILTSSKAKVELYKEEKSQVEMARFFINHFTNSCCQCEETTFSSLTTTGGCKVTPGRRRWTNPSDIRLIFPLDFLPKWRERLSPWPNSSSEAPLSLFLTWPLRTQFSTLTILSTPDTKRLEATHIVSSSSRLHPSDDDSSPRKYLPEKAEYCPKNGLFVPAETWHRPLGSLFFGHLL